MKEVEMQRGIEPEDMHCRVQEIVETHSNQQVGGMQGEPIIACGPTSQGNIEPRITVDG